MEYEIWVQVLNVLVTKMTKIKSNLINDDLIFYSLYALVMAIGVRFEIESAKPSKVFPLVLTLLFCQLAYTLMLGEKESNYYIIITMFYVQAIFYYSKVNLKTAIACVIMSAYLFIMSREAKYYEVHGTSFSDVLHDSYWLVILLLHCIICGSFFSRLQYKRAYMGLCKLICGRKVS